MTILQVVDRNRPNHKLHERTSQRGGGGGLPNSGKTVGGIRAKQEECVKFRTAVGVSSQLRLS